MNKTLKIYPKKIPLMLTVIVTLVFSTIAFPNYAEAQVGSRICMDDSLPLKGDDVEYMEGSREECPVINGSNDNADDNTNTFRPAKKEVDKENAGLYIQETAVDGNDDKVLVDVSYCENFTQYYLGYAGDICNDMKRFSTVKEFTY